MIDSSHCEKAGLAAEIFDALRASGKSSEEIFVTLYGELKQLAGMKVARRSPSQSMHATRLVSDLYLRLFGKPSSDFEWESSRHFFNTMALAMEQLLIDHSRRFKSRGRHQMNSLDALSLDGFQAVDEPASAPKGRNLPQESVEQAVFIRELLCKLEGENVDGRHSELVRRQAEIVRLRIFLGLTEAEAAEVLGCSSETVTKEFRKAKAKLASMADLPHTHLSPG